MPFVACWPGMIKEGTESKHISAFWDMMPTFADMAGIACPDEIDGSSMLPTLLSSGVQKQHEYLYWEFHVWGGRKAARIGDYKAVQYGISKDPDAPIELYDLSLDAGETDNIAEQHPDIIAKVKDLFENGRVESELFKF